MPAFSCPSEGAKNRGNYLAQVRIKENTWTPLSQEFMCFISPERLPQSDARKLLGDLGVKEMGPKRATSGHKCASKMQTLMSSPGCKAGITKRHVQSWTLLQTQEWENKLHKQHPDCFCEVREAPMRVLHKGVSLMIVQGLLFKVPSAVLCFVLLWYCKFCFCGNSTGGSYYCTGAANYSQKCSRFWAIAKSP